MGEVYLIYMTWICWSRSDQTRWSRTCYSTCSSAHRLSKPPGSRVTSHLYRHQSRSATKPWPHTCDCFIHITAALETHKFVVSRTYKTPTTANEVFSSNIFLAHLSIWILARWIGLNTPQETRTTTIFPVPSSLPSPLLILLIGVRRLFRSVKIARLPGLCCSGDPNGIRANCSTTFWCVLRTQIRMQRSLGGGNFGLFALALIKYIYSILALFKLISLLVLNNIACCAEFLSKCFFVPSAQTSPQVRDWHFSTSIPVTIPTNPTYHNRGSDWHDHIASAQTAKPALEPEFW